MGSKRKSEQLVIDLKITTIALEKGAETAKEKLKEIEDQNKKIEERNKKIEESYKKMCEKIVSSLTKMRSAISSGVEKYIEYEGVNRRLESVVNEQGLSFYNAQSFIEDYISDGLIPLQDATIAYKNLVARGYNQEQIEQTMIALKEAAAFGRDSTYEYGVAIATATEGLKNENSELVNNAGVTKNVSKMWQDYAESIGKTTESLTQAEKIEAEVNGIRQQSESYIGNAAKYAETYAGKQLQINAVNAELSKTLGESMIPILTQYSSLQLELTKGVTQFVKNHKGATSGVVAFTGTLLATTLATMKVKEAIATYTTTTEVASGVTKAFSASLLTNPLFIGTLAIAGTIGVLTAFSTKVQETVDKIDENTQMAQRSGDLLKSFMENDGYTEQEAKEAQNIVNQTQGIINAYQERKNKVDEIKNQMANVDDNEELTWFEKHTYLDVLTEELIDAKRALNQYLKENEIAEKDIEIYRKRIASLNKSLEMNTDKQEYLTKTNIKATREQLVNIAQTKSDIDGKRKLLNILKQGKTSTDEYVDAKNQLVKVYPELNKVNEDTIASTEAVIDVEEKAAEAEWALTQATILNSIAELQAMKANNDQIQNIVVATNQKRDTILQSIDAVTQSLIQLSNMTIDDFKGNVTTNFTPTTPKSSSQGASSYSNKRLDNYKREIEHKKALDQLSLQQELNMYETALRSYAKTTEEKRELREKIYDINKQLANKEKEILDQQTEDYETYIEDRKNLQGSAYDITEQTKDYNQIIQMHKNYLSKIMKDERLSLDERKDIYREELQTIRDYEQQKRDLRVDQIDKTVSQLTNAITKQLEELQEKDKEFIDKQIEEVEKLKEVRINAINAEYDAKIEAIEKELQALDKAEQQKSRDKEDLEHENKKKRLEELMAFEHDAVTKANYQKELEKLVAEYQKILESRALEDKREALNAQKELLQEEQENKVQAIEDETEKQKEVYDKQLTQLEEYYDKQMNIAQETAEEMLMNVEQNQNTILNLLKSYGDAYEITGQSLGEKLAQGINEGLVSKIENIIARIQNTIDAGIEAQISKMASSVYRYEAGANKPQTKTVNVYQTNNIEQNPEMPSETYRKLNNVSQKLAEEFAGM